MRKRHDTTDVTTRRGVLLSNLCKLLGREAFREPNKRWPKPPMNERDFSADQPAYQNLIRIGHRAEDRKDVVTFWVGPPTPRYGLADDSFGKARRGPSGRSEDDAMLSDKSQCLLSGGAARNLGRWRHGCFNETFGITLLPV